MKISLFTLMDATKFQRKQINSSNQVRSTISNKSIYINSWQHARKINSGKSVTYKLGGAVCGSSCFCLCDSRRIMGLHSVQMKMWGDFLLWCHFTLGLDGLLWYRIAEIFAGNLISLFAVFWEIRKLFFHKNF